MTNSHSPQWAEATEAVMGAASVVLVTHVSPDGDAIGSLLGLANFLRGQGKKVVAAVDGGVPDFLEFLPGSDTVLSKLKRGKYDVMVSLDSSDEERTGIVGTYSRAKSGKVINLDHHPTNTLFGDIHLVEPTAVSATQIVYEWLVSMGQPITKDVAVPLLTGLVTDTIGFRTSNVTAGTLHVAQQLMAAGASLSEVTYRALSSTPYNIIELWKQAFGSIQLHGAIIAATVTQENLKAAHLLEATDGGLVSLLATVNEAMISVVYKELADNRVELSFRSKPGYDVGSVAFGLGGGGHRQASGATIPGTLAEAPERVMPLLEAALAQGALTIG